MKPFEQFPDHLKSNVRFVLTDIDDTLTINGRLTSIIFSAMERLKHAGLHILPITGRSAGWCDHIARMWPVDGVVGENGAFYFRYDCSKKKMYRRYMRSEKQRKKDRIELKKLARMILQKVPGCQIASDQSYRETDLAIDYCEDVPPLPAERVEQIVHCFKDAGAHARISSIHVNGWFGDHDKLTTTIVLFREVFKADLDRVKEQVIFIGDSPNDGPMFAYFPRSVGVANLLRFQEKIDKEPPWITRQSSGKGFAEMVDILLRRSTG
ncbi:MAG: HAD-IIB family hydrolase [Deltaproteobacteria bacterium]|nr:HAD-IIB family hydrolase [Deltaproteobacteria bacterium]